MLILVGLTSVLNSCAAISSNLNFDMKNSRLNILKEEINMNENKNNNTNTLNNYYNGMQQQQLQQKAENNMKMRANAMNAKKILKLDELSNKLKQDALIDVFKIKLLELLDLDEAPKLQDIDINKSPVPEPIMREYNKLLRMSQLDDQAYESSSPKTSAFFSRRYRDKSEEKSHEFDANDEHIRFNSSLVQEVTLLPHRGISYLQLVNNILLNLNLFKLIFFFS